MTIAGTLRLGFGLFLLFLVLIGLLLTWQFRRIAADIRQITAVHEPIAATADAEQTLQDIYGELFALCAFTLLLGGGTAVIISRRISGAVHTLATGAAQIGSGDLDHRIALVTHDELGFVALAFNDMAAKRQQAEEALRILNAELEQRVTERTAALHQATAAERTQREYFQVTLASIGDAVIVTDAQGAVTFLNRVAEKVTGRTTADAAGKPLPEVFQIQHEETRQPVENPVAKVLRTGGVAGLANHTVLIRKDGRACPIDDSAAPIRDAQGRVLGVILVFRDITSRRQVEAERERLLTALQRANEELQQFAYIVSHDLSEPLRTMNNYVQLLARRMKGKLDDSTTEYMAFVTDVAQRMQRMLTDLLVCTRAGQTPEFQAVDCEALLAQVVSDLQTRIAECGATITHDPLPTVPGDATRLGQVFQNLIGNALKFGGEAPPCIHVSAGKEGQHWRFAVRDNGIGIDPSQAERIFQVFQRLHTHGEYPGTGIGLAICKKIVEQHGGRIRVESRPGEGSIFYFTIGGESSQ